MLGVKGSMGVKDEFFAHGSFKVGDGREDVWLGGQSLAQQYSTVYTIVR
jgi:hypothetical protein